MREYDSLILGAGLYGLYAAYYMASRSENHKILVLEHDKEPFSRATYINQARVHGGYHYPRSLATALKSAGYFHRFNRDYDFCILKKFDQVYGTSAMFSWADAEQFKLFCRNCGIKCEEISSEKYFQPGMVDGAFLTEEYTYDAKKLCCWYLEKLKYCKNVTVEYNQSVTAIENTGSQYVITHNNGQKSTAPFVLNSTYASVNQVQRLAGFELFKIKYELCEIILCDVADELKNVGLTVMDGPFFSIMPFGLTGQHSLTSVTFTPHTSSHEDLPKFNCQNLSNGLCSPNQLANCNYCNAKPESAWPYMSALARKYMRHDLKFTHTGSLFSMKPILRASEVDDSRPTVVKVFSNSPTFVSVLSGKINTVYDLDNILDDAIN